MSGLVVVTGANGFVGRALCPALRDAGYAVRPCVRKPGGDPASVLVGDVGPDTDWREALRGAEVVIHLAARAHILEREADALEQFRRVNRDGSRRLAEACVTAGVRQFVFVSSVKAVAERSGTAGLTEAVTPAPTTPYGISKLEGEQAVQAAASGTNMQVLVLRPPLVYGPGNVANMLRLFQVLGSGRPLPLASVRNRRSLVYLENLASALVAAVARGLSGTYFVSDGTELSTPELIRALGAAMDVKARLWPFPSSLLRVGATLLGRRDDAARVLDSLAVDPTAFKQATGWRPPVDLATGLRRTAQWYRQQYQAESGNRKAAGV